MIIDCIADLHGHFPSLEGGDLLIIAGDLTARHTKEEFEKFIEWLRPLPYEMKVFMAGNHDTMLSDKVGNGSIFGDNIYYLFDFSILFRDLLIYCTPWTKTFEGMNPACKAFTCDTEEELAEKFSLIPKDTDILVTHGPPYGILDQNTEGEHCGSVALRNRVLSQERLPKLKYHFFGHIHEKGNSYFGTSLGLKFYNCSYVNEYYKPVNDVVGIIL